MPVLADDAFADWLRRLQADRGLSDNALGRESGVSPTSIGLYKRGKLPKIETLRRLVRYGPTLDELIELVERDRRKRALGNMARVMIQCPKTGRAVFTGIAMNAASFESSTLLRNTLRCPACGEDHTWDKKDAHLEGQEPQA